MMNSSRRIAAAIIASLCATQIGGAIALDGSRSSTEEKAKTTPDATSVPVPSEPRETSATFGDWVARCERVNSGATKKLVCEAAQAIEIKGQTAPIAQIAFGHAEGGSIGATVLLPNNISFDKSPTLGVEGDDANQIKLVFMRCTAAGCFAEAKVEAATLTAYRGSDKPGKLVFTDAGERLVKLPFSFRGLAQALDELNKYP